MKEFLRIFQGRIKVVFSFIQELADGASYAIHR
jgi:hypothetical protein